MSFAYMQRGRELSELAMPSSAERAELEVREAAAAMAVHRERMTRFHASSPGAKSVKVR